MKRIALHAIKLYQLARFVSPPRCRFYPSCSDYMYQSIERFGLFRGTWLGVKRLSKCHPWHEGGVDEVPPRESRGNVISLEERRRQGRLLHPGAGLSGAAGEARSSQSGAGSQYGRSKRAEQPGERRLKSREHP